MSADVTREPADPARRGATRLGFWAAVVVAGSAATALALGVTTPPRSGSSCSGSCITYPYTDVAAFVPRDYFWMYPAALMSLSFVVLLACVHSRAPADKRVFSQVGLSFAAISATAIVCDYSIQLAVMQPSIVQGEARDGVLFSMYNPHGIFIALEDVGYLPLGVSFFFTALALATGHRLQRAVRILCLVSAALAIGSLVVLAAIYGTDLGYRYEVTAIAIDWITLILVAGLFGLLFRREVCAG